MTCRVCSRPLRTKSHSITDRPGTLVHFGRGLCATCWPKHRDQHPFTRRSGPELLAEVDHLDGTPEQIATRLGVTLAAIARAAYRHGRPALARTYDAAYQRARYQPSRKAS